VVKNKLIWRFYSIFFTLCIFSSISFGQTIGAGDAIEFDGFNDYVELPDIINNGDFTIEFWFYPNEDKWRGVFLDLSQVGGFGLGRKYFFIDGRQNRLRFAFESANDADVQVYAFRKFEPGQWYHVACVGGFNRTDRHRIYINGREMSSSGINTDGKPTSFPPNIRLGDNQSNYIVSNFAFPGMIDEFRIWSDERTEKEIKENSCRRLSGNEDNLECYYILDEATNVISGIKDFSGNSNNGTMHNMSSDDIKLSSAPVGDDCRYLENPGSKTILGISSPYGDEFNVKGTAGSADALVIYRVDSFPNATSPPGTQTALSQEVYYGAKALNSNGFTYSVLYNYEGHPGIVVEEDLELATRESNADPNWTQQNASLDVNTNTLILTGQTGTEFILGTTGSNNTLPIELISFEAEVKNEKHIELNWLTATEHNNDYFTIERSENGFDWSDISRIEGSINSSSIISYSTIDYEPLKGHSYYRLKQTDIDGQYSYSNIVTVNFDQNNILYAYPNPTNGILTIVGARKSLEKIKIFNAIGADISSQLIFRRMGEEKMEVDLSEFKMGFYFIKSENFSLKVLKN